MIFEYIYIYFFILSKVVMPLHQQPLNISL